MVEINNRTKSKIDIVLVKKIAEKFLRAFQKTSFEVSIVFAGDRTIRRLNKIYRLKDRVTDVLAFPGEGKFLGEIIIDYAQIKRQASRWGNSIKGELIFILVHGLLHLVGYNDETEEDQRKITRKGEEFVGNVKIPPWRDKK